MEELKAFINGIKPAILLLEGDEEVDSLLSYPHVYVEISEYGKHILFFRNEASKKEWVKSTIGVDRQELHRLLGLTLGYPPKAVNFFVANLGEHLRDKTVTVRYSGINFGGSIDDLEENIKWIWDSYQQKSASKVRYGSTVVYIPYRDEIELKRIYDQLNTYHD